MKKIVSLTISLCFFVQSNWADILIENTTPGVNFSWFKSDSINDKAEEKQEPTEKEMEAFVERLETLKTDNGGYVDIVLGDRGFRNENFSKAVIFVDPFIAISNMSFKTVERERKEAARRMRSGQEAAGKSRKKERTLTELNAIPDEQTAEHSLFFKATLTDFLRFLKTSKGSKLYDALKGRARVIFDDWRIIVDEPVICKKKGSAPVGSSTGEEEVFSFEEKLELLSGLLCEDGKIAMYYRAIKQRDMRDIFEKFNVRLAKKVFNKQKDAFPSGAGLTKRFLWLVQPKLAWEKIKGAERKSEGVLEEFGMLEDEYSKVCQAFESTPITLKHNTNFLEDPNEALYKEASIYKKANDGTGNSMVDDVVKYLAKETNIPPLEKRSFLHY